MKNSEYYKAFLEAIEEGNITRRTIISGKAIGHEEIWKDGVKLAENFPASEEGELLEEIVQAKPHLVMFGAGHVGKALHHLASFIGIGVTVIDPRSEVCNSERFPGAEILAMPYEEYFEREHHYYNPFYCIFTHGHTYDRACLRYCLSQKHTYIGMIGSKGKVATTFKALEEEGISAEALSKVHAPIGLKIGGDSPEEIAVSIMAEIISVYAEHKHRATAEVNFIKEIIGTEKGVLCRIIRKSGSGPREEGTQMLVLPDRIIGTVGGGASERKAIDDARATTENCIRHYGMSANDDLGMICGGNMDILFQVIGS